VVLLKVLVIGSGGREHALCWKIAQSPKAEKIYCAPGNAGTKKIAENVPIPADNITALLDFAIKEEIGLTVVGPEVPLVLGITNAFESRGMRIFGPNAKAALLEGSKAFAKELMSVAKILTAKFEVLNENDSKERIEEVVSKFQSAAVKADGLCAGKGVFICRTKQSIIDSIHLIFDNKVFGEAGKKIVVEELLKGEEASVLAFCDGKTVVPMISAQDHKRIFDNDLGPNTGGMGAIAPAQVTSGLEKQIIETIFVPLINELSKNGITYKGVLYAELMIKNSKFSVLEFNCRFGDPETQPLMLLLESDIIEIINSCIDGTLKEQEINWFDGSASCVVMASKGYPEKYETKKLITGLEEAKTVNGTVVFHSGTKNTNGQVLTNGGRVLGVTSKGNSLEEAINLAYEVVSKISFEGAHYRKDIGQKALK